jgi:hypothetical protein
MRSSQTFDQIGGGRPLDDRVAVVADSIDVEPDFVVSQRCHSPTALWRAFVGRIAHDPQKMGTGLCTKDQADEKAGTRIRSIRIASSGSTWSGRNFAASWKEGSAIRHAASLRRSGLPFLTTSSRRGMSSASRRQTCSRRNLAPRNRKSRFGRVRISRHSRSLRR